MEMEQRSNLGVSTTLCWVLAALLRNLCNACSTVISRYLHQSRGMDALQPSLMFGIGNLVFCGFYGIVSEKQRRSICDAIRAMKPEPTWNCLNLYIGAGFRDVCWFMILLSSSLISSADTWTISTSTAAIFTVFEVYLVFGERPDWAVVISVLGCILGTVLTAKPGFLFGGESISPMGVFIAAFGGFSVTWTMVSTQYLRGVYSKFVLAYARMLMSALLYLLVPCIYFGMYPQRWTPLSTHPQTCSLWVSAGILYSASLPLSPMANVKLGAQMTSIILQSVIVWCVLIEMIFLHQTESPLQYCGMLVVCVSMILKPAHDIYIQRSKTCNKQTMTVVTQYDSIATSDPLNTNSAFEVET